MALVVATHHSAQRCEWREPYEAPRGQDHQCSWKTGWEFRAAGGSRSCALDGSIEGLDMLQLDGSTPYEEEWPTLEADRSLSDSSSGSEEDHRFAQ